MTIVPLRRRAAAFALIAAAGCAAPCSAAHAAQSHVSGHVISHLTGQPLAGQTVEILLSDGTPIHDAYTYTDADGAYGWSGDCPDSSGATCLVELDNTFTQQYETLQAPFANGAAGAVVDFTPHALGTIRGRVTGPAGPPGSLGMSLLREQLPQPEDQLPPVALFRFDSAANLWRRTDSPRALYGGGYLYIPGVPAGRYRLCFGGIGVNLQRQCFDHQPAAPRWAEQAFTEIDLAEGETRSGLQFDLVAGGSISGAVYDAYKDLPLQQEEHLPLVRIALYDADGVLFDRGVTYVASDGYFHAAGTPKGKFRVVTGLLDPAYREDHVLFPNIDCVAGTCPLSRGSVVETSTDGNTGAIDMNVLPSVVIRGRVTDADTQQPIAGAWVDNYWLLYSDFAGTPPPPYHESHGMKTDADGRFQVYAQPGTGVTLEASAAGYPGTCASGSSCPGMLPANTAPGDVLTVDIQLQRGGTFSGTVREAATGQGAAAEIDIYDTSGHMITWTYSDSGPFRSPVLAEGTYYAVASPTRLPRETGDCQTFAARPCPVYGDSILTVAPTPIVVTRDTDRAAVDFALVVDPVFSDGFE